VAISTVRRIAAKLLKVGENRIRIKPGELKRVEEALTADDVRQLIRDGVVGALRVKGVPRIRAKLKHAKMKRGRRSGSGSRKGAKYAGVSAKDRWKSKTRLQRKTLRMLRDSKRLAGGVYRQAYLMIKGNAWRSNAAMLAHFKDAKWLKEGEMRGTGRAVGAEGASTPVKQEQ